MKKIIHTPRAPQAIGPYSQAVRAGDFVYISGQIPLDPLSGELIQGSVEDQTRQVLTNLQAIVEEAGGVMSQIVKTTVFLSDMDTFSSMNGVYQEFFSENCPARAAVEVARLPKDVAVEIEAVLYLQ